MISEHCKRVLSSFQPMPPLFQGQFNGEKFSVADIVVAFLRAEFPREVMHEKAHGWNFSGFPSSWDRITSTPVVDASTSTMNDLWGSGCTRIGAWVKASFKLSKASLAAGDQDRDLDLMWSRLVRGLVRVL